MGADVEMFGIPMAAVTEKEAVERIVSLAKEPREGRHRPHCIATVNVDFVTNAVVRWPLKGNPELWEYLKKVEFAVADGMPLVWLSRLLRRGKGLPERVTGSDTVPLICARCAEEGLGVYILGGNPIAVTESIAIFRETSPDLKIAGLDNSEIDLDADHGEIVSRINRANTDVLFLAMTHPKQELWISRNATKLKAGVVMGVGGSFNFIAGLVPRAPDWVQHCGFEWLFRICQEPGRLWKRYAVGMVKLFWLASTELCRAWSGRGGKADGGGDA